MVLPPAAAAAAAAAAVALFSLSSLDPAMDVEFFDVEDDDSDGGGLIAPDRITAFLSNSFSNDNNIGTSIFERLDFVSR